LCASGPSLAASAPAASASSATAPTLPSKPYLTLDAVKRALQAAEAEARSARLSVSIAVCDDGGQLLALHRMDDAPPATAAVATEKPRTAALIRRPAKVFEDIIKGGRTAMLSIGSLSGMLEGGEPFTIAGQCAGAIGVSGGRPSEDSQIVASALRALGLGG